MSSPSTSRRAAGMRLLALATGLSLLLNFLPGAQIVTYPVRLFTTLVHEGGHALATLLTGGTALRIGLDPSGSGVTLSAGGLGPIILMAGYVGTTLAGAGLLLWTRRGDGRKGLFALAVILLGVTLVWVSPAFSLFGFVAGIGLASLLFLAARFFDDSAARFLTSFLAVQLCLNALYDVRDLFWMTTQTAAANDAVFMAQRYGGWPWMWAAFWAVLSVFILGAALRAYFRQAR